MNNMIRYLLFVAVFTCHLVLSPAQVGPAAGELRLSLLENDFLVGLARVNMFQVRLGMVASERRGVSSEITEFGRRMVEAHSKLQEDLKKIAEKYKVFLPNRIDPYHKEEIERLTLMPPGEFDRKYREMMIRQHGRDIAVLNRISEKGKIPEIRQFARDILPRAKEMLEKARSIEI